MKKILGQFDKSVEEVVFLKIHDFKGMNFIDFRTYKKTILKTKS